MRAAGLEPRPGVLVDAFNLRHRNGPPVSFQSASRWLSGGALPDMGKLQTLAQVVGVDPCHLLFGTPTRMAVGEARAAWGDELRAVDRQMLQAYLQLPAERRRLVRELVGQLGVQS